MKTKIKAHKDMINIIDNKYTTDHYSIGKYKGFQFFKPKKEEEIQFVFEGKIQLREDERMDFFL